VAILHSHGASQLQAARKLQHKYRTELNATADIFEPGMGQAWGWKRGDKAIVHFLCGRTGFDAQGAFFLVVGEGGSVGGGAAGGDSKAANDCMMGGDDQAPGEAGVEEDGGMLDICDQLVGGGVDAAPSEGRGEQRLRVVDVVKLLLHEMEVSRLVVILDGVERGTVAARAVASIAGALQQSWQGNRRRELQRLVVGVASGGRLGALSEALVEVNCNGVARLPEWRRLFAATAGRDVYLVQRNWDELKQLVVAERVLRAAWLAADERDRPEVTILFHQCDEEYGIGDCPSRPTVIRGSWLGTSDAASAAALPALMLDLRCGDTAAYEPVRRAFMEMLRRKRGRNTNTEDALVLTRQCACATLDPRGEPRSGGDHLVAAVALLLVVNADLRHEFRKWPRALKSARQLEDLLCGRHGGLGHSAHAPLALVWAADQAGAGGAAAPGAAAPRAIGAAKLLAAPPKLGAAAAAPKKALAPLRSMSLSLAAASAGFAAAAAKGDTLASKDKAAAGVGSGSGRPPTLTTRIEVRPCSLALLPCGSRSMRSGGSSLGTALRQHHDGYGTRQQARAHCSAPVCPSLALAPTPPAHPQHRTHSTSCMPSSPACAISSPVCVGAAPHAQQQQGSTSSR
jgi:hypothetical protein